MALDVYADLLFLINFFMDYACLRISARAGGCSYVTWRLCLASALGGVYSIAALFLHEGVLSFLLSLAACVLISAAAFQRKGDRPSRLVRISLLYLGVSTLSGGFVSASFRVLNRFFSMVGDASRPEAGEVLSPEIYLSLAIGSLCAYLAVTAIKKANVDKAETIKIYAFGGELALPILSDSGNRLRDPVQNKPCTVISDKDLIPLAGEERTRMLVCGRLDADIGERVCVIPAGTVNASSVLFGFLPRRTVLLDASGKQVKEVDTVIAVSGEKSFSGGRAVVPGELMGSTISSSKARR